MKLQAGTIHKIAIFRALKLGDMLCAVPALRALRSAYPNAEITLLGLPWTKIFAERFSKYINRFIHFPGYQGLPEQPFDRSKTNAFIKQMQQENFDLLLQMHGNGTVVNDLLFSFKAKNTAGFFNNESYVESPLFMQYPQHVHEIERHVLLMEHLGLKRKGLQLEFPVNTKDEEEFKNLYLPLADKKFVCIHPGSADVTRQWPPQYFATLADFCIEQNFTVVVTGTKEEREVTQELIKRIHHPVVDLTGKTSLGIIAIVIQKAYMLIANCTGVSHIAAAVETPSVIISMDGESERWQPLNKTLHFTIDWTRQPDFKLVFEATNRLIQANKKAT